MDSPRVPSSTDRPLPLDYRALDSDREPRVTARQVVTGIFRGLLALVFCLLVVLLLLALYTLVIVFFAAAFVAAGRLEAGVVMLVIAIASTIVFLAITSRRSWRRRRSPVQ
jgi:uncharacterized membrane protein